MKRRSRLEEESRRKVGRMKSEGEVENKKGKFRQANGSELESGENREIRDKEKEDNKRWFIIGGVKNGELALRWDMRPGPKWSQSSGGNDDSEHLRVLQVSGFEMYILTDVLHMTVYDFQDKQLTKQSVLWVISKLYKSRRWCNQLRMIHKC